MRTLNIVALALIIIGGINWGLVGLFDYNLVDEIFTKGSFLTRTIYGLVGVAALWMIYSKASEKPERAY